MKLTPTSRSLLLCAALGAGEFCASCAPTFSETWPVWLIAALLLALFGHASGIRGWSFASVVLVGVALYFHSIRGDELNYREAPWMRHVRQRGAVESRVSPLADVKRDLSRRVSLGIGANRELVQLNRAILLGERGRLPRRLKETFVNSGTIHVFAISGLHVMALAQVLMLLLRLAFVPRRFVGVAVLPLLWGYILLIGSPPSAVRAALMASLCCLAPVFGRRPNGVMAWAVTFLTVYGSAPKMIGDVGCALSFAVMFAILVTAEFLRDRPEGFGKTILISLSAWAAGVPIAAHVFGRVTPGGLLANLALIPAACCTVYTGVIGLLVSYISEPLAAHLNSLSALFTHAMVIISECVARLPGANVVVPKWSLLICAEWYMCLALVFVLCHLVKTRRDLDLI